MLRNQKHEETVSGLPNALFVDVHHTCVDMVSTDTTSIIIIIISNDNKRNSITITVFIIFSCNCGRVEK